jgi:hypothetical protein
LSKTSFVDDAPILKVASLPPHVQQSLERLPLDLLSLFEQLPDQVPSAEEDAESASRLYALLTALDPAMAERWHWKDTRKVLRSLEIIKEKGRLPSEIVQEQSHEVMRPRYVQRHTLGRQRCRRSTLFSSFLWSQIPDIEPMAVRTNSTVARTTELTRG